MKHLNKNQIAKILIGAILTGATAHELIDANQNKMTKDSFSKIIEEFQDDTLLDEAEEENIAMYEDKKITEVADELIQKIEIINELKVDKIDITNKKLTQEEIELANSLTIEDLKEIDEKIKNNSNLTKEIKEEHQKILSYGIENNEKWLLKNAKEITKNVLLWTIKSTIANELNLPVEEIDNIKLKYTNKYKDLKAHITYDNEEYKVSKDNEYLLNSLWLYYQIKTNDIEKDEKYNTCKTALTNAKLLIMSGITEENNNLKLKRTKKEIQKVLKRQ